MSHDPQTQTDHAAASGLRQLSTLAGPIMGVGLVAGVAGIALSYTLSGGDMRRFGLAYLTGWVYFLTISVGALFFVIMQHLTRAGWSVTVRRVAELMSVNLITLAILAVPIAMNLETIYAHWAGPEFHKQLAHHHHSKATWLSVHFFQIRMAIYLAIWIGLALWFHGKSVKQDITGDTKHTATMQGYAGLGLVLFALTTNFGYFDLIMSLDPHWYSTVFGVYTFAGGNLAFFASAILVSRFLQSRGRLTSDISREHYHDLGKYMFGWTVFWGYIAFSQYMLIWYGNIPEETAWYARRGGATNEWLTNGWGKVCLFLLFGNFVIPFFGLLSRYPKRWLGLLTFWALWTLGAHFVDLYWVIMPENTLHFVSENRWVEEAPRAALGPALASVIGIGGLWVAGLAMIARKPSLVPVRDPRLGEALSFENY